MVSQLVYRDQSNVIVCVCTQGTHCWSELQGKADPL